MGDHRRFADAERLDGPLVCTCPTPVPEHIGLFDGWQCKRCWRAILHNTHQSGSPI